MSELLSVEGLRKSYGAKVVLGQIDLSVNAHDVICLIGAQRLRQVHAAAVPQPAGDHR